MKRILMILACVLAVAVLSGCNTVRGAGKDLEKAGDKIQDIVD